MLLREWMKKKKSIKRIRLFAVVMIILACVCGMRVAAYAEDGTAGGSSADGASAELQLENGVPLVIVRVDETTRTIDHMNASYDHSARCEAATVEIRLPEG